jgi:hypothetical protein
MLPPADVRPPAQPCDARRPRYRPWAQLLRGTFGLDVETWPRCGGRMRLLAVGGADSAAVTHVQEGRDADTETPTFNTS